MAHIPDGVLALPILLTGWAVTVAGCGHALKRLEPERIPEAGLLGAVFFVAALVHFPVGPSSAHLILNGLVGIALGWTAFPAVLVALSLEALLFGFGGVVVLGANVMNMAVPAVLAGGMFTAVHKAAWRLGRPRWSVAAAGAAGALGVLGTALMVAASLGLSGEAFRTAAALVLVAHAPVMVIEAVFTAAAIGLILKVKPEFLERGRRPVFAEAREVVGGRAE